MLLLNLISIFTYIEQVFMIATEMVVAISIRARGYSSYRQVKNIPIQDPTCYWPTGNTGWRIRDHNFSLKGHHYCGSFVKLFPLLK